MVFVRVPARRGPLPRRRGSKRVAARRSKAQPWVPPSSVVLRPGESLVVGVRFILAAGPDKVRRPARAGAQAHELPPLLAATAVVHGRRCADRLDAQVEEALLAAGHPVVVGVPGLVVHADAASARLFVKLAPSSTLSLKGVEVHPPGALTVERTVRSFVLPWHQRVVDRWLVG